MSIAYRNQLRKVTFCVHPTTTKRRQWYFDIICDPTQCRMWRQRRHVRHHLTAKCQHKFSWYYANIFLQLRINSHVPLNKWNHNPHHHSHWWPWKVQDTPWNGPLLTVVVVQLERGFLFVSTILWVEEFKTIKISTVTFMRDFLRERHVTCRVTFTMSSSRL